MWARTVMQSLGVCEKLKQGCLMGCGINRSGLQPKAENKPFKN